MGLTYGYQHIANQVVSYIALRMCTNIENFAGHQLHA